MERKLESYKLKLMKVKNKDTIERSLKKRLIRWICDVTNRDQMQHRLGLLEREEKIN